MAVEDVERKSWDPITPNARRQFDWETFWICAHLDHCCVKGSKVALAESTKLRLIVGHVLKVFNPCSLGEKITHFNRA